MYHYNYKITNVKTNEYYIGVRSCKCKIEDDKYMGSSTVWTKAYIKANREFLIKEILEIFPTRKLARDGEVVRLKEVENDTLCINCYFGYTPDLTGTHQTPEHIEKRKMFGERNGMYGKKHKPETIEKMRQFSTGRKHTQESKDKIGKAHRGKVYSEETREKIRKARSKIRRIVDITTNEEFITSIPEFCKTRPELKPSSMKAAANFGYIYHERYRIYELAATNSDISRKLGENGETLEIDNSVGSVESDIIVQQTAND